VFNTVINNLKQDHCVHMEFLGVDNRKRLTGTHETSPFNELTYGIGDRSKSLRIATTLYRDNNTYTSKRKPAGYIEDRRPSANMDPYVVCSVIAQSAFAPALPHLTQDLK
jgi:glutamine synthetase